MILSNNRFKVGDKVVPHAKTTWCNLSNCNKWNKAKEMGQPFLYVIEDDGIEYALSFKKGSPGGNYYNHDDLTLYNENKNKPDKDENKMTTISIKKTDYQFQIGQKVRVKRNLERHVEYYMINNPHISESVSNEMIEMGGKTFTITDYSMRKYRLDGNSFGWTDGMLEPVRESSGETEVVELNTSYGITIYVHKAIYSDPATVIFYKLTNDPKEKLKRSVSKCLFNDKYSKEKGYEVAVLKAIRKQIDRRLRKF